MAELQAPGPDGHVRDGSADLPGPNRPMPGTGGNPTLQQSPWRGAARPSAATSTLTREMFPPDLETRYELHGVARGPECGGTAIYPPDWTLAWRGPLHGQGGDPDATLDLDEILPQHLRLRCRGSLRPSGRSFRLIVDETPRPPIEREWIHEQPVDPWTGGRAAVGGMSRTQQILWIGGSVQRPQLPSPHRWCWTRGEAGSGP